MKLIDADALLDALRTSDEKFELQKADVYDIITNAPAVEGEVVGYVRHDNFLLGSVIKGQWLTKEKVEDDDVAVYVALPSTPSQSLVEHDNEVIERCASVKTIELNR